MEQKNQVRAAPGFQGPTHLLASVPEVYPSLRSGSRPKMHQVRGNFSVTWRVRPDLSDRNLTPSARRQVPSAVSLAFFSKTWALIIVSAAAPRSHTGGRRFTVKVRRGLWERLYRESA